MEHSFTAPVSALDVSIRLSELARLQDEWLDGHGKALDRAGLSWLDNMFLKHYPQRLMPPFTYPTEEGGVLFEWHFADGIDASLEINLQTREGYLHVYHSKTGEDSEQILRMDDSAAWESIAKQIRGWTEGRCLSSPAH